MKAIQINKYGGTDVLEINENVQKPSASKEQVIVEIYNASINPFDWKVREGYLKDVMPLQFPTTLGVDFSGVIKEVGEEVTDFKTGDEVYGQAKGSFAEFAIANTDNIALKPSSVNFVEAASMPLVGSSAIQALEEHIKLQNGQKILIHGGAGGIGHVAIQLAKELGAYVATTVSSNDVDFVKELGADEVIDYKSQKFEEILKDFDAVFDTVGGETLNKSFEVVKKGAVIVTMVNQPDKELVQKYSVTAIWQFTDTNTKHLKRLAQLVDNEKIKVNIDKVFPLPEIKEAFKYQEEVHPKGKVVIKIKV